MRSKRKRENLDSGCTSREREEALSDVPVSFAEVWRAGTLYDAAALVNGEPHRAFLTASCWQCSSEATQFAQCERFT